MSEEEITPHQEGEPLPVDSPSSSEEQPADSPAQEAVSEMEVPVLETVDAPEPPPEPDTPADGDEAPTGPPPEGLEILDAPPPEKLVKAVLFASPEWVTISTLKRVLGDEWDGRKIRALVHAVNRELQERDEPFEVAEANHAFLFRTKARYHPWLRRLFKEAGTRKLSQAALEILAIIAYKQPITKAEVEDIRGVNVDGVLKGLLDRKLVEITGRSQGIGAAYAYGTSRVFLQYFGINDITTDLPKLTEFEELAGASALLPQISRDGTVTEAEQGEADAAEPPEELAIVEATESPEDPFPPVASLLAGDPELPGEPEPPDGAPSPETWEPPLEEPPGPA